MNTSIPDFGFPLQQADMQAQIKIIKTMLLDKKPNDEIYEVFGAYAAGVFKAIGPEVLEQAIDSVDNPNPMIKAFFPKFLEFTKNKDCEKIKEIIILLCTLAQRDIVHNIIAAMDRFFAYRQNGGTCYAYACAYVVLEAEARIVGRRLDFYEELVNSIIARHGTDGGDVDEVLQELCDPRRLRFLNVSKEEGIKAAREGRAILGGLELTESQWQLFKAFFKDNPHEVLKNSDLVSSLELDQSSDNRTRGHTVVIVGYDETKEAWMIKNSWGVEWASLGYSYLSVDAIPNLRLWDVLESDLTEMDQANFLMMNLVKEFGPMTTRVFEYILRKGDYPIMK